MNYMWTITIKNNNNNSFQLVLYDKTVFQNRFRLNMTYMGCNQYYTEIWININKFFNKTI